MARDPTRLRLAYIASVFPKVSETFVFNEVLALQRLGHDVVPFALRPHRTGETLPDDPVHQELLRLVHTSPFLLSSGVWAALAWAFFTRPCRVARCVFLLLKGLWRYPVELVKTLFVFPKTMRFAREMEQLQIQHLHAHWASFPTTAAMLISILTEIPYSFTCHAHDVYLFSGLMKEKLALCAFASPAHCHIRDQLLERAPRADREKLHVLRVGINVDEFSVTPRDYDWESRPWRPLSVGRLAPMKGHIYLVKAIGELAGAGISLRCQIIGDGPLREELEAEITASGVGESVELIGAQSNEEVRTLLGQADAFVLPSILAPDGQTEGIPFALMEAMACGLPAVASDVGGIRELVRNNENGLLVVPGDIPVLVSALKHLHGDSDICVNLGEAARETVAETYNAKIELGKKLDLFARYCRDWN